MAEVTWAGRQLRWLRPRSLRATRSTRSRGRKALAPQGRPSRTTSSGASARTTGQTRLARRPLAARASDGSHPALGCRHPCPARRAAPHPPAGTRQLLLNDMPAARVPPALPPATTSTPQLPQGPPGSFLRRPRPGAASLLPRVLPRPTGTRWIQIQGSSGLRRPEQGTLAEARRAEVPRRTPGLVHAILRRTRQTRGQARHVGPEHSPENPCSRAVRRLLPGRGQPTTTSNPSGCRCCPGGQRPRLRWPSQQARKWSSQRWLRDSTTR